MFKKTFFLPCIRFLLAAIWFTSGLWAKILDYVPRHTQIVGRFFPATLAREFTIVIGCLEMLMAVWILSRIGPRLCAVSQVLLVLTMTLLEVLCVSDLLLFGPYNLIPGLLFCGLVFGYAYGMNWFRVQTQHAE